MARMSTQHKVKILIKAANAWHSELGREEGSDDYQWEEEDLDYTDDFWNPEVDFSLNRYPEVDFSPNRYHVSASLALSEVEALGYDVVA